ncbi:hypothetical protein [Winogradskyella flava]|uniref:hypothetical protein n=1 Tax=Winogradskyella flava TaxID=1884876 RepID=UPI002492E5F2|nr:hypothetical protein [Winogradskyella flava]
MRIAIITRPDNKSPKNLAITLAKSLDTNNIQSEIFYDTGFLTRMVALSDNLRWNVKSHYRIRQKLKFYFKDLKTLRKLKTFQAVIICECIPNAMWRNVYPIESLRSNIKLPIGLYEVFFLESAPHFIDKLKTEYHNFTNPYDFELAISSSSYTKIINKKNQFKVGFNLMAQGIKPINKDEFIALIDFEWEGEKKYILEQKKVLDELGIKYLELKGNYTIDEIREVYSKCSVFFLQHFESFGLPIAESLSYGAQIFTANSGWPMAFRLNDDIEIYGKGSLADCFTVYKDEADLRKKLLKFKKEYTNETPFNVFNSFIKNYPDFYEGNNKELEKMTTFIENFNS